MVGPQESGTGGEHLSREELITKARQLVTAYAEVSIPALYDAVRKGEGKQSLGFVSGRPGEHQIGIDSYGDEVLSNLLNEQKLSAYVLGEHNPRNVLEFGPPQMIITIDPFDNSRQYQQGLDTSVYTVVGAYSLNGKPLAGVICDIKDKKSYIAVGDTNYVYDNDDPTEFRPIRASSRTTIMDDKTTIATYLGEKSYSVPFIRSFGKLMEDMPGLLYAGGGAYIYGLLAKGAVDAYVMTDEPHSEILPGLPLALAAGCTVISVNPEDGTYSDFRFNPELIKNPEGYKDGSVPLFMAACTTELAEEIIRYYLRANNIDAQPRKVRNGMLLRKTISPEPGGRC